MVEATGTKLEFLEQKGTSCYNHLHAISLGSIKSRAIIICQFQVLTA